MYPKVTRWIDSHGMVVLPHGIVVEEPPGHGASRSFHLVADFQGLGAVGGVGEQNVAGSGA